MQKENLSSLVAKAQAGDNQALNDLFTETYNDVYYFALKTIKDESLAADVTQDTFVTIFQNIDSLNDPVAYPAWSRQITYRHCLQYLKKQNREVAVDENEDGMKRFYNELITKHGLKPNSMEVVHTILNPVFEKAVFDNLIRKNPCIPAMKEIRQMKEWQPKKVTTKYAFTVEQQMAFVDFMRNNPDYSRWKNILTVLLGTGMRIGECTGLVWKNCDFKNDCIYITHTLIYRQWEDGTCGYRVHPAPKTKAGIRTIPMMKEVREALLAEKAYQEQHGTANTVIDGYSDWVFTNRYGTVLSLSSVNDGIARIIRDYNEMEKENAELESRDAVLIPHMTTHQLRHSFCTRLMEESINNDNMIPLAVIQSLMGHKDVKTTIEIYTDVSEELKRKALERVKNNIYLGQANS